MQVMLRRICGGHVDSQIRRNSQMIVLGLLIILSIPVLVESQTHGLAWGFTPGERFYFKETHISNSSSTVYTSSFEYYLIAEDYLTIQDPLTFFPIDREETFYYNGTQVMSGRLYFAVPIGNWDLLEGTYISSYSSYYDTIDIIDEETSWGFRTTKNLSYVEVSQITIFSKTDGVLVFFLYERIYSFGDTNSVLVERVTPPLNFNNPVLIAGASIIFIGLLVLYFFRRLRSTANQESIDNKHSS
ncbi:MAG: hypothetical protein KGD60_14655 [Candidatus Thorarchaeota archaeon]|nr:hypothetical protein [Candidatus Thorarchaeota archaeon]